MSIKEITKLSLPEFISEFEKNNSKNKFTELESELNILQFAILSNNIDVVKYLLNNYPYDLKEQIDSVIWKDIENPDGYKFTHLLMLSFDMFEESRTNIESYNNTIHFFLEQKLLTEKLNFKNLTDFIQDKDSIKAFLASPYFQSLMDSNLIDNDILNFYISFCIINNASDSVLDPIPSVNFTHDYYRKNTCEKIIKSSDFKIDIDDIVKFISIIKHTENLTNLTGKELLSFKQELIQSFLENNKIKDKNDLFSLVVEYELSLYEERMSNRNKLYNLSMAVMNLNETKLSDKLYTLLKRVDFDTEKKFPVSEKIKSSILNIKDLSLVSLVIDSLSIQEKQAVFAEIMKGCFFERSDFCKEDDLKNINIEKYAIKRWGDFQNSYNCYHRLMNEDISLLRLFKDIESSEMTTLKYAMLADYLSLIEEQKMIETVTSESIAKYGFEISNESSKTKNDNFFKYMNFYKEEVENNLNLKIIDNIFESNIPVINSKIYRANISERNNEGYDFLRMLFNLKMEFNEINEVLSQIKGLDGIIIENMIHDFLLKNKDVDFSFLAEEASTLNKLNFLENYGVYLNYKSDNLKIMHNLFINRNSDKSYEEKLINTDINLSGEDMYTFLKDAYIFAESYSGFFNEKMIAVLLEDKIQNTWFDLLHREVEKGNNHIIGKMHLKDFNESCHHFYNLSFMKKVKEGEVNVENNPDVTDIVEKMSSFKEKTIALEKHIISSAMENAPEIKNTVVKRKRM